MYNVSQQAGTVSGLDDDLSISSIGVFLHLDVGLDLTPASGCHWWNKGDHFYQAGKMPIVARKGRHNGIFGSMSVWRTPPAVFVEGQPLALLLRTNKDISNLDWLEESVHHDYKCAYDAC